MHLTCSHQTNNYYTFGRLIGEGSCRGTCVPNGSYNGKELDRMHGLNLYDYSARQYDPTTGQFTSMDPLCEKYYHISPYAYCAGNPVKYVDPDGRELYLSGNDEERRQLLALLQSLTNNVLVMNKQGVVSIGKGKANTKQKLTCGTGLIKDIIGNQHKMTMSVGKKNSEDSAIEKDYHVYADKDGSPRSGADVVVTIDLKDKQNPIYLVGNDPRKAGKLEKDGRPLKIGVAHELVHGLRGMEGVQALPGASDSYFYTRESQRNTEGSQESAEELRTIGITGNYRYTENKIRREHGLKERRMYNPIR